jgi:hypothetical protein
MVRIVFGELRVNHISNSSGIFTGENRQTQWRHTAKSNDGFGEIHGDKNRLSHGTHIVIPPNAAGKKPEKPVIP